MTGDERRGDQFYLSLCKISARGTRIPTEQGRSRRPHTQRQGPSHLGGRLQPPAPNTHSHPPTHLASVYRAPTVRWLHSRSQGHKGEEAHPPARQFQHYSRGALGSEWGLWATAGIGQSVLKTQIPTPWPRPKESASAFCHEPGDPHRRA